MFKKFNVEDEDEDQLSDTEIDNELHRPLTRSSIKPRLLFPSPQQVKAKEKIAHLSEDDEEAVTDIEEHGVSTPAEDAIISTPKATKFAPASPPTTVRATRSKDVEMSSPTGPTSGDRSRRSTYSPTPILILIALI